MRGTVKRSRHVILKKSSGFVSAGKLFNNAACDSQQVFFAASEVAISRVNSEHQLWEKQTSGRQVQYNLQEGNNCEFVATDPEENGYCSVEHDCVDLNRVEVDLACDTPPLKGG